MVTALKAPLTVQRVRDVLSYDESTGQFTWRVQTSHRVQVGDVAGCMRSDGYLLIGVDGRLYRANRLAVFYMTGCWPRGVVDHRNTAPADNKYSNLRDTTQRINCENLTKPKSNNRTGFLGVSLYRGRYRATIQALGKRRELGVFDSPADAHQAYLAEKRRIHQGNTL